MFGTVAAISAQQLSMPLQADGDWTAGQARRAVTATTTTASPEVALANLGPAAALVNVPVSAPLVLTATVLVNQHAVSASIASQVRPAVVVMAMDGSGVTGALPELTAAAIVSLSNVGILRVVIPAGALTATTSYRFQLRATLANTTTTAFINVTTASVPAGGQVLVTPAAAVAGVSSINVTAVGWTDVVAALPLRYQFTVRDASDGSLVLSSDSSTSAAWTTPLLPLPRAGAALTATVSVVNVFGAVSATVMVVPVLVAAPQVATLQAAVSTRTQAAAHGTTVYDTVELALGSVGAALDGVVSPGAGADVVQSACGNALNAVTSSVVLLQVAACAATQCGTGQCVLAGGGARCDCTGTNMSGSHCEVGNSGAAARLGSESAAVCPSLSVLPCSGHGTCNSTIAVSQIAAASASWCRYVCECVCECVCVCVCVRVCVRTMNTSHHFA